MELETHSGCEAPVLVRIVSRKNMKMTKTARPTQKQITIESTKQTEYEVSTE